MRPKFALAALPAACLLLAACDIGDLQDMGRFNSDFHYSYDLAASGRVLVETFNGSVEISGWDQNTVDISGTKYGRTQQEADDLKVTIDHARDSVSIRVIRPTERRGNWGARFVLKVPRAALLDRITTSNGAIRTMDGSGPARLKTSNGPISVNRLHGSLDAETSNGPLDLTEIDGDVLAHTSNGKILAEGLNGSLEVSTSNGAVRAVILRPDKAVRLETSNSSVDVTLPEGFSRELRAHTNNSGITLHAPLSLNAHVMAHTSNSSIASDFDVHMQGNITKNSMDATVGSGGALLDLVTSNGSITLAKMN